MLKVLYLLNHAGKGGTERYVESLIKYLGGTLVEPFFAYNEEGLLAERVKSLGVPCRQISLKSRFDMDAAKALAALCAEWDIDIIHCHFLRENYIALLAKKYNAKIRVVYTNHIIQPNDFVTKCSNKLLDKRQDQIIAVCNPGREQLLRNGWNGEKIQVIFNAVNPEAWQGGTSTLRQEFGIPAENLVMIYAARFVEGKGHRYLVDSIKKLTELTAVPFTMVLPGDGPLLEETKALVTSQGLAGRVVFTGFREDMKNLCAGSDICINASRAEALSYQIIEAMAAGLPAIVTDVGGNRDIVPPDAQCGILVEYDNPASMAQAMKTMLEDEAFRSGCAAAALQAVKDKFEIRRWSELTYGVYERAIK
ncbi:MAG: glycosyltransferase family 4 protein [Oscillospiraceae bacterium]